VGAGGARAVEATGAAGGARRRGAAGPAHATAAARRGRRAGLQVPRGILLGLLLGRQVPLLIRLRSLGLTAAALLHCCYAWFGRRRFAPLLLRFPCRVLQSNNTVLL